MMDGKVRKHINDCCEKHGWEPCEAPVDYEEALQEAKELVEVGRDEHRWYFVVTKVVELDGMFIQYDTIDMKGGDATAADAGLEFDVNQVFEVEPYDKTVTAYRRKKYCELEWGGDWDRPDKSHLQYPRGGEKN